MATWKVLIGLAALTCGQGCSAETIGPSSNVDISALSQREIEAGVEAGLGCNFRTESGAFLVVTVGEALIKLDGVVRHFRLDDDRALAVINYGGNFGDRVVRVLIDRDDATIERGEEGSVRTARLTLRTGTAERTLNGKWACGA